MSHRQKNAHKSRHRTHAKKSDSLFTPKTAPDELGSASGVVKRLTPVKTTDLDNRHNIVAPM